jgi:hypothetical protein
MRLSRFLLINSIVALVFGLGFVLGPAPLLSQYGVQTDAAGIVMSRFFGAALIQLGVLLYIAQATGDKVALRAMVVAGLVGSLAGLAVALSAQLTHVVNSLGWSTVVLYALFLAGYAMFAMRPAAATTAV